MFEKAREDLRQVEVAGLPRSGLESLIEQLSSLESSVAAVKLDAMAAIDALADGGVDSSTVARTRGKASERRAKQSAKTASKLTAMPKTRKKLAEGAITAEHAESAAEAAAKVEDPAKADDALAADAEKKPADLFAKEARTWAEKNRPDRGDGERARQRRNRHLRRFVSKDDGSFGLSGTTDTNEGEELWKLIEAEANRLWRDDGGRGVDAAHSRTGAQRRWDALLGLVQRGAGRTPGAGDGVKPPHPKYQGLLTMPIEDLLAGPAGEARAELIGAGPIPPKMLWRMLCDASLTPMIVDVEGQPLWMGREIRTATPAQWKALIARDQGCVVCGADPSRCEAHHVEFWEHFGPTDITNLTHPETVLTTCRVDRQIGSEMPECVCRQSSLARCRVKRLLRATQVGQRLNLLEITIGASAPSDSRRVIELKVVEYHCTRRALAVQTFRSHSLPGSESHRCDLRLPRVVAGRSSGCRPH